MIEREGGCLVFHCDNCSEVFESEEEDFNFAWGMAKQDGWRVRKIGDEWVHSCPACEAK